LGCRETYNRYLDEASRNIASFGISHSYNGIMEFTKRLNELSICSNNAYCFIETSRGLLVSALLQQDFKIFPLNPKVVDRQRRPSGAKTDFIDARLLADIERKEFNNLKPLIMSNELIEELRLLTRDQEGLVHAQTPLTNQLIACLKELCPALQLMIHANNNRQSLDLP